MRIYLFPLLFIFISCSSQTIHDDPCYFPLKECFTEKQYCYVNQNDTTEKSFWKLKTSIFNNDTLFQTSIFDTKNRISEIMTERVQEGNSKILTYTIYNYTLQGDERASDCKIIDSLVFSASQKLNEEIQWKVNFNDFLSPNTCELTKIRILKGKTNTQRTFIDLMRFEVLETKQGYQYHMTSVYENGKGLISYKLSLPGGKVKDYLLTNIK